MSELINVNNNLFSDKYKKAMQDFDTMKRESIDQVIDSEIAFRNSIDGATAEMFKKGIHTPEDRERFLENLQFEASQRVPTWYEVMSQLPSSIYQSFKASGISMARVIHDTVDIFKDPSIDPMAMLDEQFGTSDKDYITKATENIYRELGETTPQNMTTGQWIIYNSTVGIAKMLPFMAGAKILGAGATVGAGANFFKQLFSVSKVGLALSGMSAADKYNELIAQGTDKKKAAAAAITYGSISYFANKIPLERLLKPATSKGLQNLFINMLGETAAEVITDLGHHVVDLGIMGEDKTLGDLMSKIKDTAILTPLMTAGLSTILVRVPNLREANGVKINKAMIIAEINRNNQITSELPLMQKMPEIKGFEYNTFGRDKDGKIIIAKTAKEFADLNGFTSETVEAFKTLLEADPSTADLINPIPERTIEQKVKSFVENGTFTISLASDLKVDDFSVYEDMGNRMLKLNELANMDLPQYITQEVVDNARNRKINQLISEGVVDIDNHPAINILDNIDKRLSMRERDVKRYRAENSLSMAEHIEHFKKQSAEIEVKHQDIAKKLMEIDTLEKKLKKTDEIIQDPQQINKLRGLYEDVNIAIDEVDNIRKSATERLNRITDNKKIVVTDAEKSELKKILEPNSFDDAISGAVEALTTVSGTVADSEIVKQNIDLKSIKDKDVRELVTSIVNDIDETVKIRKQIRDTKDKETRKVFYNQIDVKKQNALAEIEKLNKGVYNSYETIKLLENEGKLSPEFIKNFKSITENMGKLYNEIMDVVDTETFFKDLRESTESNLDDSVKKLNKLMSDYSLQRDRFYKSVSGITDNVTRIKAQAGIIKNIDPSMLGMDLQMFAANNIDDASSYIENMYNQYASDISILPDLEIIKNGIEKLKNKIKKDNFDNWNNLSNIKKKDEHFSIFGRIAKEFTQPHNINNEIYQAYVDGLDDITTVEKARKKADISALMAAYNKLSHKERIRLFETAQAYSNSQNKVMNFAEFSNYIKNDDILSKNPEKYFQAYESYKRGMDRVREIQINPILEKFPDLADVLEKTRHNYYIPMRRKPGNFSVIVREAANPNVNWFYGTYQTKAEADTVIGQIKRGEKALSPDNKTFVKLDETNSSQFDIIGKEATTSEKLKNASKYVLGIFPEKEMYKTRNEWSSYMDLTDTVEMAIDQATYNLVNSKYFDPNKPVNFDQLSKSIKENLLKLNRSENALGNLFMEQKGVAGLETEQALQNINEAVVKAVNSATRFEMLDYHKAFIENNFNHAPDDIKSLINRYYEANINNPDVFHQLAAKISYANVMYHIGGSAITTFKNLATVAPMTLAFSGDYNVSPVTVSKNMLNTAPRAIEFISRYAVEFTKDMVFNSSSGTENLTRINELALKSGFSEKEAHFLVRMFRDGYITTGITSEFDNVFLGDNNSVFKKTVNGSMLPFKLSEIAVRAFASTVVANSLIEGGKFKSLDDAGITEAAFKLVNKQQPRGGVAGRIIGTQRKGITGAALRAATSLINFTFNFGSSLYDQSMKGWDVFKKEKGFNKITKNNYFMGLGAFAGSMFFLGGAKALPFSDDMRRLYRKIFKDDDVLTRIEDKNSAISRFVNGGLLGLMYIDVPGLGIGVPVSVGTGGATGTMYRNIASGLGEVMSGVSYGNWDKVYRGVETAAPSLIKRLMRSGREYFYGLSTKDGVKLIDPATGKQRSLTAAEALIKLTGLQLMTENYTNAQVNRMSNEMSAIYNSVKQDVLSSARRHVNNGNPEKAMKEIQKFNEKVIWYYRKYDKLPTSPIRSLTTAKED